MYILIVNYIIQMIFYFKRFSFYSTYFIFILVVYKFLCYWTSYSLIKQDSVFFTFDEDKYQNEKSLKFLR